MDRNKIVLVGLSWFRSADDFAVLRPLMVDDNLPVTYADWIRRAEEQVRKLEASGYTVHRAYLDPVAFPLWCARNNRQIDAEARRDFAAREAVARFERKDG